MIRDNLSTIRKELPSGVTLVAVSKFHPSSAIREAYEAGQRDFAESRPQELAAKAAELPPDIRWHFIGHLQRNKLKMVLPYAYLIHSVDSVKLLDEIQKFAAKDNLRVRILLEVFISSDSTKQGFSFLHASDGDLQQLLLQAMRNSNAFTYAAACAFEAYDKELREKQEQNKDNEDEEAS